MMKLLQRLIGSRERVEFCDECGQVCTSSCRVEAQRDRIRSSTAYRQLPH